MRALKYILKTVVAAVGGAMILVASANAATITNGFTFSVASEPDTSIGDHFHSSTGGDFGNPAGKAEVGRFSIEEVRGLSEYDLTGLANAASAFVTFNVLQAGGLFAGTNDFPFDGTIMVEAYSGNNSEDIGDYQAATNAMVGSFATAALSAGDVLSFDITSVFNDAIDNGFTSLGMRLRAQPLNDDGAWTFDTFRLTTEDETTVAVAEPATLATIGLGLAILGFARRRQRAG